MAGESYDMSRCGADVPRLMFFNKGVRKNRTTDHAQSTLGQRYFPAALGVSVMDRDAVCYLVRAVPEIRQRHTIRVCKRTAKAVSHAHIDEFFADVEALQHALRRVNCKNAAALDLLACLYEEMSCRADALAVRQLSQTMFDTDASLSSAVEEHDVPVRRTCAAVVPDPGLTCFAPRAGI